MSELLIAVEQHSSSFIFIQETWLNADVASIALPGYSVIARRDRSAHENRGGVLSLCRSELFAYVVHVHTSVVAERMWHLFVSPIGALCMCNWYRPGSSSDDVVLSFKDEYGEHGSDYIGSIIAGDLNFHSIRWLRHSSHNARIADIMQQICAEFSLIDYVRQPTRGNH